MSYILTNFAFLDVRVHVRVHEFFPCFETIIGEATLPWLLNTLKTKLLIRIWLCFPTLSKDTSSYVLEPQLDSKWHESAKLLKLTKLPHINSSYELVLNRLELRCRDVEMSTQVLINEYEWMGAFYAVENLVQKSDILKLKIWVKTRRDCNVVVRM